MTENSSILKIVKEDILRILAERKEKVSLNIIKFEVKVPDSYLNDAIYELKREKLVHLRKDFFELTAIGEEKANNILAKHLFLEEYFERTRNGIDAHGIAHILEHYIAEEVISTIKMLSTLKKQGVPLTELEPNEKGLISDIMVSDNKLFERIISMGIFPGEAISIVNEIPSSIIVKVKNKKFALGKNIAKE